MATLGQIVKSPVTYAFSCEPGWEAVLASELRRVFPLAVANVLADGWVISELDGATDACNPIVAFASQCLPDVEAINAISIADWVQTAGPRIIDDLSQYVGPWRLHVFGVYRRGSDVGPRRAALIEAGVIELLKKKQRRLLRTRTSGKELLVEGESIIQLALVSKSSGFLSIAAPAILRRLADCISPFCGGIVKVPADRRAPSRAFAKLVEAEIRTGRRIQPGESCVDLGSSPGSWAYVALNRGANVIAVDRSPLRADLMKSPSLKFIRGDAFRFQPTAPVDWLLCDVVAFPDRVFELLKLWIERRWCQQFCVTIKFRGADEYPKLEPIKRWLAASGTDFILRRLTNNKNEVTVVGSFR